MPASAQPTLCAELPLELAEIIIENLESYDRHGSSQRLTNDSKRDLKNTRHVSRLFRDATTKSFAKVVESTVFASTKQSMERLKELSKMPEVTSWTTTLTVSGMQFARPTPPVVRKMTPQAVDAHTACYHDQILYQDSGEYMQDLVDILPRFAQLTHLQYIPYSLGGPIKAWLSNIICPVDYDWELNPFFSRDRVSFGEEGVVDRPTVLGHVFKALCLSGQQLSTFSTPCFGRRSLLREPINANLLTRSAPLHALAVLGQLKHLHLNISPPTAHKQIPCNTVIRALLAASNVDTLELAFTGSRIWELSWYILLAVRNKGGFQNVRDFRVAQDAGTLTKACHIKNVFGGLQCLRRLALGNINLDPDFGDWTAVFRDVKEHNKLQSLWLFSPRVHFHAAVLGVKGSSSSGENGFADRDRLWQGEETEEESRDLDSEPPDENDDVGELEMEFYTRSEGSEEDRDIIEELEGDNKAEEEGYDWAMWRYGDETDRVLTEEWKTFKDAAEDTKIVRASRLDPDNALLNIQLHSDTACGGLGSY
ncbi:hypothetical protein BU16DRAFT_212286 [Lophium mytilinum]|uniref:Uncharacterized protein n=1 Tax=Lophium mytilinum TaxID=390894 RepID=A0A6A6REP3_9PEZI|nr:hypothetical protein BU16DRAFT_212286 [Lophium mytilinum]